MAPRKGSQNPTAAVTLSYKRSHGREAVALYNSTGRKALPWQEKQIRHILAINKDGLYTHMNYGLEALAVHQRVSRVSGDAEYVCHLLGVERKGKILHFLIIHPDHLDS